MYQEQNTVTSEKQPLAKHDGFVAENLAASVHREIAESEIIGDIALNAKAGVAQELVSVVKAGRGEYAVIKVVTESGESYAVAKVGEKGERSQLLGQFLAGDKLVIGRTKQQPLGGDNELSREHFEVITSLEGGIVVSDLHSTNGTALISRAEGSTQKFYEGMQWAVPSAQLGEFSPSSKNALHGISPADIKVEGNGPNEYAIDSAGKYIARHQHTPEELEVVIDELTKLGTGDRVADRNGHSLLMKRYELAKLRIKHPETHQAITDSQVAGFHGTRSSAFAGILESGQLKSARQLNTEGALMTTGEHFYQNLDGQSGLSFSDLAHTEDAANYASSGIDRSLTTEQVLAGYVKDKEEFGFIDPSSESHLDKHASAALDRLSKAAEHIKNNPDSLFAQLAREDFPILIGIAEKNVTEINATKGGGAMLGPSHLGEFRPATKELALSDVPVVAVPAGRVALTQKLLADYGYGGVLVMPIEHFLT